MQIRQRQPQLHLIVMNQRTRFRSLARLNLTHMRRIVWRTWTLLSVCLGVVGCNLNATPSNLPTETPTSLQTPALSLTSTFTPTFTATQTASLTASPSLTPSVTLTTTPSLTPSLTMIPSPSPEPVAAFLYDNSRLLDIPPSIRDGLDFPLVAFLNINNRQTIRNLATAQPGTNIVTLYYSAPTGRDTRVAILEYESKIQDQVYLSPLGNAAAYFYDDPIGLSTGLWVLNVSAGVTARISNLRSLTQRGLFSAPSWSPDGRQLALALATGYDLDLFLIDINGAQPQNLTNTGSYDWSPAWSPDGRYLAFLSDRVTCPSWIPGEAGACVNGVNPVPTHGYVFVVELSSGAVTQISEQPTGDTLRWVNNRLLAYSAQRNPTDLLDSSHSLYLADVPAIAAGTAAAQLVALQGSSADRINVAEAWSADGQRVFYQEADNALVIMNVDGSLVARSDELVYSRFGVAAAWSPNGDRLAIGGVSGRCPYGRTVLNIGRTQVTGSFEFSARGFPPPSMCGPFWSPDGAFVAYTGVIPSAVGASDGRVDVYISDNNGFGSTNLTSDLRGQIELLGWVGR